MAGKGTILVVDDNAAARGFMTKLLRLAGYRVLEAADEAAAMRLLQKKSPVMLLIADIMLADGMDGVRLALAALAERPELRVILTTGYAEDALARLPEHSFPILPKPYRPAELYQLVARVTGQALSEHDLPDAPTTDEA